MKHIILEILSGLAGALAIFFYGKRAEKKQEQNKQNEESLNEIKKANKISFNSDSRNISDVEQRMRKRNIKK